MDFRSVGRELFLNILHSVCNNSDSVLLDGNFNRVKCPFPPREKFRGKACRHIVNCTCSYSGISIYLINSDKCKSLPSEGVWRVRDVRSI